MSLWLRLHIFLFLMFGIAMAAGVLRLCLYFFDFRYRLWLFNRGGSGYILFFLLSIFLWFSLWFCFFWGLFKAFVIFLFFKRRFFFLILFYFAIFFLLDGWIVLLGAFSLFLFFLSKLPFLLLIGFFLFKILGRLFVIFVELLSLIKVSWFLLFSFSGTWPHSNTFVCLPILCPSDHLIKSKIHYLSFKKLYFSFLIFCRLELPTEIHPYSESCPFCSFLFSTMMWSLL